jgi:hypothetical protein
MQRTRIQRVSHPQRSVRAADAGRYVPMSFKRKYDKSLAEQWCMRFKTTHPDGDNYAGIVTHVKPGFIILREEESFELDGVLILPKRSIKGIRDGKYDRCCNEILRQNGALKKLRPVRWLDSCETIPQVISSMMRRDVWPAIETVPEPGDDGALYVGPITGAGSDGFSLWCYDAAGRWEKEYELGYDEIFRIEFDSKYCNHFNRYMKSKGGT